MSGSNTSPRGEQSVIETIAGRRTVRRAVTSPEIPRPSVNSFVVEDPDRLQLHLNNLQRQIDEVYGVAQSIATGSGVLIKGITMTAGVGKLIEHRLGRAITGWKLTRVRAASGTYPSTIETTLPTGRSTKQWLQLESSKDCTLDVYVF